jgi:hypothetical protein
VLGDVKRLSLSLRRLQLENQQALISLGYDPASMLHLSNTSYLGPGSLMMHCYGSQRNEVSFGKRLLCCTCIELSKPCMTNQICSEILLRSQI